MISTSPISTMDSVDVGSSSSLHNRSKSSLIPAPSSSPSSLFLSPPPKCSNMSPVRITKKFPRPSPGLVRSSSGSRNNNNHSSSSSSNGNNGSSHKREISPRRNFLRQNSVDASESSTSSSSSNSLENLNHRRRSGGPQQNKLVRAEKIVQRSSSKTVKTTLALLKEQLQKSSTATAAIASTSSPSLSSSAAQQQHQQQHQLSLPPMTDLIMLRDLATDSFYRVILTKYHGKEIIKQVQERFVTDKSCFDVCKRILDLLEQPNNDKTFLETNKGVVVPTSSTPHQRRWKTSASMGNFDFVDLMGGICPTSATSSATTSNASARNSLSKTATTGSKPEKDSEKEEDILQLINRECRLLVETKEEHAQYSLRLGYP